MVIPFFLAVPFLLTAAAAAAAAAEPFSHSLLHFKSTLLLHDSNALSDWSSRIHVCSWSGVQCNANSSQIISLHLAGINLAGRLSGDQFNLLVPLRLQTLNLSHNSFSGPLPPEIFNLTTLTSLDISRNNFSGPFPAGIPRLKNLEILDAFSNSFSGDLPADVAQVETLKVVNFAGSYFSGQIPNQYGSFRALQFLHLAGNFLSGNLPPELGNVATLEHIEIGYNSYHGGIPWQFGNLSALQYLDIADANISGPIPPQIGNLTKLESLFLFKNQLQGLIPDELTSISPLKSLDLSDNLLSGPIPDSFSKLKNLKLLSLMYNDLTGPVPPGIATLPQLDTLLIWSNLLTGTLPDDLGRHSKLQHVDVSTNYFVGTIPPGICSGGSLLKLILFSNNFTGGLHPSLSNCPSLIRLRLEDNSFSGELSSLPFRNLPDISYLDVSRNKFTGGIPSDVDKASQLQYLNVSYNPIGGSFPFMKLSMPNLENLSMISCGLSSTIPEFESCEAVSAIELGSNNFSGRIPESLSNCRNLVRIDLSDNQLTGVIPAKFGTLPSLKLVNVSNNDITGTIPGSEAFKTMNRTAFLGNPKLCGAPLRGCHHGISNGLELGSRRAQKVAWILILCAAIVLFLLASVFAIIYFEKVSKSRWKTVRFEGLPPFSANDVLRGFNHIESSEVSPIPPHSFRKVVLPTGATVAAKKIHWEAKETKAMLQILTRIGNARHKNLVRLLGICYNNQTAYLLYDYMPNGSLSDRVRMGNDDWDWEAKCRTITGIANVLHFLHHRCYPAIPHGNLKLSNVLFDEKMEAHVAEYGLHLLTGVGRKTGGATREADVMNFGEMIEEVFCGKNGGEAMTEVAKACRRGASMEEVVKMVQQAVRPCS